MEDLGNVSQIESVVELRWNGQKGLGDIRVQVDCRGDGDAGLGSPNNFSEVFVVQETSEYALKDECQRLLSSIRNVHDLEVTHESRGKDGPTTIWRSSRTNQREVLNLHPREGWSLVESMLVDQLPKEFNRWLGSVLLHCRHIDIVDEDEALCISLSSPHLLSLLDQL